MGIHMTRKEPAFPALSDAEVNDMDNAKKSRFLLRQALLGLLLLALGLAACMIMAVPARAASRQTGQSHRLQQGETPGSVEPTNLGGNFCDDPQQITLDCLNIIKDGRPFPNSTIQNPIGNGSTLFFLTSPADTIGQLMVGQLWGIMLIAVDVCGALMLLLNGLSLIIGGTIFRFARAVETIPGMLLALIAAHLSLIFIGLFLGFNNAAVYDLYQWAGSNIKISLTSGVPEPAPSTADVLRVCGDLQVGSDFCTQTIQAKQNPSDALSAIQITPQNYDFTAIMHNISSLDDMLSLTVKIMSLMLLAQVLIRLFFIDLYIVLAPLGIACWALPGKVGQPLTRLWWQGFLSIVLVQFVQVIALIVVEAMLLPIFQYFYPHIIQITHPVMQVDTLVMVLNITMLWFVYRIPSLFHTAPMGSLIAVGQAMSAMVNATLMVQIGKLQMGLSAGGGLLGFVSRFI